MKTDHGLILSWGRWPCGGMLGVRPMQNHDDDDGNTFIDNANRLHPSLRRILGQYKFKELPRIRGQRNVIVATDGTMSKMQLYYSRSLPGFG